MRLRLLAAVAACFAMPAVSQDEFLTGEALQATIAKDCADGCITFNREEAEDFQKRLDKIVTQRTKEAFEAGVAHQKQACASLI